MNRWAFAILTATTAAVVAVVAVVAFAPSPQGAPQEAREAPIVIRLDLTPEAMQACATAFVRYGFSDVREYECRLERTADGVVVALYGPDYRDPDYTRTGGQPPVRRLGAVPLGGE